MSETCHRVEDRVLKELVITGDGNNQLIVIEKNETHNKSPHAQQIVRDQSQDDGVYLKKSVRFHDYCHNDESNGSEDEDQNTTRNKKIKYDENYFNPTEKLEYLNPEREQTQDRILHVQPSILNQLHRNRIRGNGEKSKKYFVQRDIDCSAAVPRNADKDGSSVDSENEQRTSQIDQNKANNEESPSRSKQIFLPLKTVPLKINERYKIRRTLFPMRPNSLNHSQTRVSIDRIKIANRQNPNSREFIESSNKDSSDSNIENVRNTFLRKNKMKNKESRSRLKEKLALLSKNHEKFHTRGKSFHMQQNIFIQSKASSACHNNNNVNLGNNRNFDFRESSVNEARDGPRDYDGDSDSSAKNEQRTSQVRKNIAKSAESHSRLEEKLKSFAFAHHDTLTSDAMTDLLFLLRSEGFLNLPSSIQELLSDTEYHLWNIEKKVSNVKKKIDVDESSVSLTASTAHVQAEQIRNILGVKLPIDELARFFVFEANLEDKNRGERAALKMLFKALVVGCTSINSAINQVMSAVLHKNVQLEYSGCGRRTANRGQKYNFSATATFSCIRDVLEEKFCNHPDISQLIQRVGRWLSQANRR